MRERTSKFSKSCCCEIQGQGCVLPENSSRRIDRGHIHKNTRDEPYSLKCRMILSQRDLVVSTGGIVSPTLLVHDTSRDGFEIKDVEHFVERWFLRR